MEKGNTASRIALIFITAQPPRNQQATLCRRHATSSIQTLLTQRAVTKNETLNFGAQKLGSSFPRGAAAGRGQAAGPRAVR